MSCQPFDSPLRLPDLSPEFAWDGLREGELAEPKVGPRAFDANSSRGPQG